MPSREVVLAVLAALLMLAPAAAQELSDGQAAELFASANDLYDSAVDLLSRDPDAAAEQLIEAATRYRLLLAGGYATPSVYRNLGHASLLSGETGEAILAYRRALLRAPFDSSLRQDLEQARQRAATESVPPVSAAPSLLTQAAAVARLVPAAPLVWCCVGGFSLAFFTATIRLLRPSFLRRPLRLIGAAGLLVGLLAAAPIIAVLWHNATDRSAVVIEQTRSYTGPDELTYQASSWQPAPGAEVRILETESGWARIAGGRGSPAQSAWMPRGAVRLVAGPPFPKQMKSGSYRFHQHLNAEGEDCCKGDSTSTHGL